MASVSWTSAKGGNWATAGNWTDATTGKHHVPGSGDDATIDTTASITVDITSNPTGSTGYVVDTLYIYGTDTLELDGGSLSIIGSVANFLYGVVLEASATSTLTVSGVETDVIGLLQQLAGSVLVQSGVLWLQGGGSTLEGTVAGAGWLALGGIYGTTELLGATLTVAHCEELDDSTVEFAASSGASVSYAGLYDQLGGQLEFEGDSASFSGPVSLGGTVGDGSLTLDGAATLDGTAFNTGIAVTIDGTATLRGGTVSLGDTTQGSSMEVLAGATLRFADTSGIGVTPELPTTSVITVDDGGTLLRSGAFGASTIEANLTLTAVHLLSTAGTIAIATGCALELDGTSSEIGGLVTGAGTLALGGYQSNVTFGALATLDVGTALLAAGNVYLDGSQSYAGTWLMTGGDLIQTTGSLALTGTALLEGGVVYAHTISATSAVVGGYLSIDKSTELQLSGSSQQTGVIVIGTGSLDTPTLDVLAGATYTIEDGAPIYSYTTSGLFKVAGTLVAEGPATDQILGRADITGALVVSSGTLDFAGEDQYGYATTVNLGGKISGAGTLELGGGTRLAAGSALSVAALDVNGSLALVGSESYAGALNLGADATLTLPVHLIKTKTGYLVVRDTLTLGGAAWLQGTVTGGGVLASTSTGVLNLASGMVLDGGTTLSVAGVAEQYGIIDFGSTAGDLLDILPGASFTDDGGDISTYSGARGTVENAGTFSYADDGLGGSPGIEANVVNIGLMQVLSGNLELGGTVTGTGSFEIASGATLDASFPMFEATGAIGFAGAFAQFTVLGGGTFGFAISGFAGNDEIDFQQFTFATAKKLALAGGVLTVADGTDTAHITVGSAAKLSEFTQQSDGIGGIAILHA